MNIDLTRLIETNTIPKYTSLITVTSTRYVGKVCLVTDKVGRSLLYKWYSDGGPLFQKRSTGALYLVGVFVGIELAPRLLLFREHNTLYHYYEDSTRTPMNSTTVEDYLFECIGSEGLRDSEGQTLRLWRII